MNIEKAFISEQSELTILEFLIEEISLSKKRLKDCLFKGGVWLKRDSNEPQRIRQIDFSIKEGDEIHIYYDAHYLSMNTPKMTLIEQAQDISVWQKPEGISETISLYSDHLNFDRVIELSLPKEQDCYLIYPVIAYCDGPALIAHSRRSASKVQNWIDSGSIHFSIEGTANQEFYDFLSEKLSIAQITVTEKHHNQQKSPKLQHTSGTFNFEINHINSELMIKVINDTFLAGIEEHDDGRSKLNLTHFTHPDLAS